MIEKCQLKPMFVERYFLTPKKICSKSRRLAFFKKAGRQNSDQKMEKSQLVAVLRSCSKQEMKAISKWLRSPAHNLRTDVVELFDFLSHEDRLSRPDSIQKEAVWAALWPSAGAFDDARIRQTMFFLLQSIENFLVYQELSKDEVRKIQALAAIYRRRQLEKPFRQSMEIARRAQVQSPFRNSVHLQNAFSLEMEHYKHLTTLKGNTTFNLQEVSDSLDLAFVAQKLWISCLMLTGRAVYKAEYDTGMLPDVLQFIEIRNLINQSPAIETYYYCLKTIEAQGEESTYRVFEQKLLENQALFPQNERRVMFLAALNFCISKHNAGQSEYTKKALELYKAGFENQVLLEDGRISHRAFTNAVWHALKLGEFDWVELFLKEKSELIEEKHRNSTVHFNLSRFHFEKGDRDRALELLNGFEYGDLIFNLIAKTLLLKIYFEKGEITALESLLDSFSAYLRRKEVLGYHKTIYKNLLSLAKKLIHLPPRNSIQKEKLRKLIAATNPLTERDWLLAQLEKS